MHIATNGIHIHAAQAGAGDTTLVFLHYWGGSSRTWSPVMQQLADSYHCVALDARGAGASEAPAQGYRIADLADDVQGAIAALQLRNYVLVGHSMGGKTAQLLASRRPAGLRGLALVASSPPSPMAFDDAQRAQMRSAYANEASVKWVLDNVLTGSPIGAMARQQAVEDALRLSPQARDGWLDSGSGDNIRGALADIEVPVLVLAGDLDRVDPLEVVQQHIVPQFRDPQLHILPQKGHLLPLEAPEAVAALLRSFVAALEVPA